MRGLKALYSQRLRNHLASHKPFSLISCHYHSPQNPRKFPSSYRRTIHSTSHRLNNEFILDRRLRDILARVREKQARRGVPAVSNPQPLLILDISLVHNPMLDNRMLDFLFKIGGEPLFGSEPESSNGGEEDADKERTYESVIRRESVGGGSEKQGLRLLLGRGGGYVNREKVAGKDKVAWVRSSGGHSRTTGFEVSENVARTWFGNQGTEMVRLTDVNRGVNQTEWRIPLPGPFGTEVARVLGGGLVPGSLVLVGGDPGVGKSTLLLQIAAIIAKGHDFGKPAPVVYVSGEESVGQIGHRADRMTIETEELFLYSSTDIEDVFEKIQHLSPRALVVDSIQKVYLKGVTGSAGGLLQVKECTSALLHFAKRTGIPVILSGHVTKTGEIAGPRVLEHDVDVVLYMEGEKCLSYRLLRSIKNRFGSTDELGVFEMSKLGLQAVSNPSEMFLTEQQPHSEVLTGLAVAATMNGSRTFLIEIQALCVSGASNSRQVNGVQSARAEMIISVLKKQTSLKLQHQGIFLNVVSGVSLSETASDLAVAAAICSSFFEVPIPNSVAFIGEIGLGGELHGVPRMEKRVHTVARLGFKKCIVPKSAEKSLNCLAIEGTTIVGCRNLKEMINIVFGRT